jgi:hypothetical protein
LIVNILVILVLIILGFDKSRMSEGCYDWVSYCRDDLFIFVSAGVVDGRMIGRRSVV